MYSRRPTEKWTGDITALWTYEGWLSLAVVLALFSRRVIGWARASIQDETLIENALHMALLGRQPTAGRLVHADRGSQETSDASRAALANAGITVSTRNMEPHRHLVRSCGHRLLVRDAQGRRCGTRRFPDARASQANHLRVCRVLLQPHSAALFTWLCQPACF